MTMSLLPRFMLSTIQWPNVPSELATTGVVAPDEHVLGGRPARIVVAVGEELGVVADEQAARLQRRAEDAGSVARLAGKEPGAVVGSAEVLRHEGAVSVDVAAGALRDPDGFGAVGLDDLLHLALDDVVGFFPRDALERVLAAVFLGTLHGIAQTVLVVEHFLEGQAPRAQPALVVRVFGVAFDLFQHAVLHVHEHAAVVMATRAGTCVGADDGVAVLLPRPRAACRVVLRAALGDRCPALLF